VSALGDLAERNLADAGDDVELANGLQALMAFEDGGVWQRNLESLGGASTRQCRTPSASGPRCPKARIAVDKWHLVALANTMITEVRLVSCAGQSRISLPEAGRPVEKR
jgi:hypothetical protein